MNKLNSLYDKRVDCISIQICLRVEEYLSIVHKAYKKSGGIIGQRDALKTKSAIQIRQRMINDISSGTVLPPVVIGIISVDKSYDDITNFDTSEFLDFISSVKPDEISLIDGMQRTTAIIEAMVMNGELKDSILRVEFWIAKKINSLIYRMLVLNTGQVPWNLRRQIEVIYRSLIDEIEKNVSELSLLKVDERGRRSQAGQYQADDVIELYLAFGSRKEKINTKEKLADEFTRLDFIEATEKNVFTEYFFETLNVMVKIDKELGRYENVSELRFSSGKDLFNSQPARIGFVTAVARKVFGRPGNEKTILQQNTNWDEFISIATKHIEVIRSMSPDEIKIYLSFDTLNEKLSIKSARVGDYEREFFLKSFETLIDEKFLLPSYEACWRSY